jgi:hypothetical protein
MQMSKITEFVSRAIADALNTHAEMILGFVHNQFGQTIGAKTGINIKGAKKILTYHAVRHAFAQHGTQKSEAERGQKNITIEDFDFLQDILSSPDDVIKGDIMKRKNHPTLVFSKKIKGKLYNVIASLVASKHGNQLFFNTMFIKI